MKIAMLFVCCLGYSISAYAGLGDQESVIEKDRAAIGSEKSTVQTRAAFHFHEMAAHGKTVREFADSSGKIFAVSWRGINDPDLSVMLSGYYNEFKQAKQNHVVMRGRRPEVIKTAHFTFERSGHMRDLRAVIYLNDQLPAGVKPEDLQ